MKQKRLIFASILLASSFSITYLFVNQNYNETQKTFFKLEKSFKFDQQFRFAEKTPRNEIWEQMNEWVFFKRTSSYYIIEKSVLKAYFISKDDFKSSIDMIMVVEYKNKAISQTFKINNVSYEEKESRSNYRLKLLSFKFNLLETFDLTDYSLISNLLVYFVQGDNPTHGTQYPLKVTIKHLQSKTKTGSMICSKCYYFRNKDDYKYLLWWIELNKQIGYDKIQFCNQSIPNNKEFYQIFDVYKDFIEVKQFHSIPNFKNLRNLSPYEHDYLTDYTQLSEDQFDWNLDGYHVLYTNECFLENANKYEYVTVVDNDETILPTIINDKFSKKSDTFNYIKSLNLDSIKKEMNSANLACKFETKTNYIESYLKSFGSNKNFHFGMAYYLKDVDLKRIFNAFEVYFSAPSFDPNSFNHVIKVIDHEEKSENHNPYNYKFVITTPDELSYARNLLLLYRNFVEKFENKYEVILNSYSEQFHRFFYISGEATDWLCGKSIWHTDKTSEYSVHYGVVAEGLHTLNFNSGHNGHFRINYPFKAEKMKITELSIDFNYLNCFYKPIIKKFANITIF